MPPPPAADAVVPEGMAEVVDPVTVEGAAAIATDEGATEETPVIAPAPDPIIPELALCTLPVVFVAVAGILLIKVPVPAVIAFADPPPGAILLTGVVVVKP